MDPIFGNNEILHYSKNNITIHRHLERFTIGIEDVDLIAEVKITHLITERGVESMYNADIQYYDNYLDLQDGKNNGSYAHKKRGSIKIIINEVIESIEAYRDKEESSDKESYR